MKTFIFLISLLVGISTQSSNAQNVRRVFADAEKQTTFMLDQIPLSKAEWQKDAKNAKRQVVVSPRSLSPDGKLNLSSSKDWTSGFFPGVLWLLFDYTGDKKWESQAREFTANIENEKLNGGTHDMGFKIYNSFGQGYRLTSDQNYKEVIIRGAKTLSKRFNPVIGCIRSWDHSRDKWGFPVIIDNMLNLELLFAVSRITGDSSFYKIAVSHANTTLKNHFRSDYSSYHVLDYDTITGKVLKKNTHQGFSHESSWSRGQAWGLYGFTMCYRETKDPKYLLQAEKIASFLLNHPNMPKDLVPYWDFDAPNIPNEPRDASAGAVICSALFELSNFSKNGIEYRKKANLILANLTKDYRSAIGANRGFLLLHSTGTKLTNIEVDVPIIYADYYYLEALIRSQKLKK